MLLPTYLTYMTQKQPDAQKHQSVGNLEHFFSPESESMD
jgi:hypothetical protein